ncbi:MAG: DUF6458 family protein [Pseudonocardia sp.]
MRIGSSIGLIALGLILALAVNVDLDGLDLNLIGWILTAVGLIGLIVSIVLGRQARTVVAREPAARETYVERDPRY